MGASTPTHQSRPYSTIIRGGVPWSSLCRSGIRGAWNQKSVAQVFARQKDIMFGSRSRSHIAAQARLHRLRHVVRTLFDLLPEDKRNTPEVQELADYGCATTMHLLEINAEPLDGETNSREYDFSPATINARWQAGYVDTCRVIARRPWDNPIDPAVGVAVYASDANKNVL